MESILTSVKELVGIAEEYAHFDSDIIMYVNNVFFTLKQLGVGPKEGFYITDDQATWDKFLPDNAVLREATKAYMGAKVKLKFDPPTSSAHMESLKNTIAEFEWRANVEVES